MYYNLRQIPHPPASAVLYSCKPLADVHCNQLDQDIIRNYSEQCVYMCHSPASSTDCHTVSLCSDKAPHPPHSTPLQPSSQTHTDQIIESVCLKPAITSRSLLFFSSFSLLLFHLLHSQTLVSVLTSPHSLCCSVQWLIQ